MTHQDIPGWFDFGPFYTDVARACPNNSFLVEVGCWLGRSVVYLAEEVAKTGKDVTIFAVDTWLGSPTIGIEIQKELLQLHRGYLWHQFVSNIRASNAGSLITPMCMTSVEAATFFKDGSVFMAFIDADHGYESVKADIAAWWPKVQKGGMIAGHDYQWASVSQAVQEAFKPQVMFNTCWKHQL
jgi:cephalosporin hydroxylase